MLKYLIHYGVLREPDFLYPLEFKRPKDHSHHQLGGYFLARVRDKKASPDQQSETYPLLGFLLMVLGCDGDGLPFNVVPVLQEAKKEICEIISYLFDMATNTHLNDLLLQTTVHEFNPTTHTAGNLLFGVAM